MPASPRLSVQSSALPEVQPLILATRNPGKVRELADALRRFGFDVRPLPEDFPEIEETGRTFEENALLKAHAVADTLGLPALADDSGLEVDALNGAPGVYSATVLILPSCRGKTTTRATTANCLPFLRMPPARVQGVSAAAWLWRGRASRISSYMGYGKDTLPMPLRAIMVLATIRCFLTRSWGASPPN